MANNTSDFHPIIVREIFFQLISRSIVLQLWGYFKSTYAPINLEYRPVEVVRPSFLAFEPFLTYTLIGS
jgi:hypothetical protein